MRICKIVNDTKMIWKRSENEQKGEQDVFVHKAQKKNERLFALISERRNQN